MKTHQVNTAPQPLLLVLVSLSLCGIPGLRGAETDPRTGEITKTAEAFVEAFHKGDAKAVAAFWTPDGDFVDENSRVFTRPSKG